MELKPCPFCGGAAELKIAQYPAGDRYRVACSDCGATTWPRIILPKNAEKMWNRRTADAKD